MIAVGTPMGTQQGGRTATPRPFLLTLGAAMFRADAPRMQPGGAGSQARSRACDQGMPVLGL